MSVETQKYRIEGNYIHRPDGSRAAIKDDGYLLEYDPPREPKFKIDPEEALKMIKYMASCEDPDDLCDEYNNRLIGDGWTMNRIAEAVEAHLA